MGISIWHLLILFLILLFAFGPSRIEGIGRSLGRAVKGFKDGLKEGEESSTSQVSNQDPTKKNTSSADKSV